MNTPDNEDGFYIGYLPQAPAKLGRFARRTVIAASAVAVAVAAPAAIVLPYFGQGRFEFGHVRRFTGVMRCEAAPRLVSVDTDYLLVGAGKRGVAPELCGLEGRRIAVDGTLIEREGRQLIEIAEGARPVSEAPEEEAEPEALGRFTLRGEIVDTKCYFGVMNPGEGRLHRACAVQCLRGGVPAAFVSRDRSGASVRMLVSDASGRAMNARLLPWVGEPVEASGEVVRRGRWLVFRIEPESLRLAANTNY